MKVGETEKQYVWVDGKRVPFKVTAVKPKNPKDYDPPQGDQESAKDAKPEQPKAAESK